MPPPHTLLPSPVQAPLTLAPDEAAIMQQFTVLNRRRRKFNTLSAAGRIEELLEAMLSARGSY